MPTPQTFLHVPFAEKDQAKPLGARWDKDKKQWYWPGGEKDMPEGLRRWLPASAAFSPRTRTLVLSLPFELKELGAAHGARWNPQWRCNTWSGEPDSLPEALKPFRPHPLSWEDYAERQLNHQSNIVPLAGTGEIALRSHQGVGVAEAMAAHAAGLPGFLLGDDAGLGKTITGWQIILSTVKPGETVFVVCPLSVMAAWRETILKMGHPGYNVIILNYDRLNRLFKETDPKVKKKTLKGLARRGEVMEAAAFIWDESQRLRNLEAARTKFALRLYETGAFHVWQSATAGENPLELGYMMPLLIKVSGIKAVGSTIIKKYEDWCRQSGLAIKRGAFGKWDWDGENNPDDCRKLHELLFSRRNGVIGAIRRRPEDIAGWPALQRIPYPVDLSPAQAEAYALEWRNFLQAIRGMPAIKKHSPAGGLAALTRFRQKASLLRVDSTVELALELLEEHHQVAISCQWLGSARAIQAALAKEKVASVTFTGEDRDREGNRKRFQRGEVKVIIFSVEEGINLQQGEIRENDLKRAQIDHDIRWSAISMKQIDHRCHRDGKFAKVYWSYATDTKEVDVAERVLKKLATMGALSGDDPKLVSDLTNLFLETTEGS